MPKARTGLSNYKKKRFLYSVLDNIVVNYNASEELHHLRLNFRLPVMSDISSIFKKMPHDGQTSESGTKSAQTLWQSRDQTTPVELYSTVTDSSSTVLLSDQYTESNCFYLLISVDYYSATLWNVPYSEYQEFLFNSIHNLHLEGKTYKEASDLLKSQGYTSPTGKPLDHKICWSIHKKRLRRLEKIGRKYEPEIIDVKFDITGK